MSYKKICSMVANAFFIGILCLFIPVAWAQSVTQEVSAEDLHQGCDLRPDQFHDPVAQQGCANACFTALGTVSTKAHNYRTWAQRGLWVAVLAVALVLMVGLVILARVAGSWGWTRRKVAVWQGALTVVALGVGVGADLGVYNTVAWPHMQATYQDLLIFKQSQKTGASDVGGNGMSCQDLLLKTRVQNDTSEAQGGAAASPSVTGLVSYEGIAKQMEPITELRRLSTQEVDARWQDMSLALSAADGIDPRQQGVNSVIDSSKVFLLVSKGVPFPHLLVVALGLGAVLGWLLGFVVRRFVR